MTIHAKKSAVTGTDISQGSSANVILESDVFPSTDIGEFAIISGVVVGPGYATTLVNIYQGAGLDGTLIGSVSIDYTGGGETPPTPFVFVDTSPVDRYTLGNSGSNGAVVPFATLVVEQVG